MTIIELLYDNEKENNELYNFILIFIKNKKSEINNYSKNIRNKKRAFKQTASINAPQTCNK